MDCMDIMDKMDGMGRMGKAVACPVHKGRVKDPTYYPEHQKLGKSGLGVGIEHEHD
jgi:hypothetical protein